MKNQSRLVIVTAFFLPVLFCIVFTSFATNHFHRAATLKKDSVPGYLHPIGGTVYLDKNGNGKQDRGERGIPGIAVSDGFDVVLTDKSGAYLLPNERKNAAFVFVHQAGDIKQNGQAFFHRLLPEVKGRFDFGLQGVPVAKNSPDSTIRFVQLTDSHIRNPSDRDYMQRATTEIYEMDPKPDFIVVTGDLVDWGVDEHFRNYVAGMQTPPVPYFNVFGNHELVFGPIERYHKYIGPDYYSFEQKGILFLALNCVTPSERQNEWLAKTLDLLARGRPVVVFQHFPPSLEDLERFGRLGVRSVFTGHWHSEKEMMHAGVQSINSPPFIMGGIDASPAGFKLVHLKADGSAETDWRYSFQDKRLTIVSPQEGISVDSRFPVIVNAYETSHEVASIKWRLTRESVAVDSGMLQQASAISWVGVSDHSTSGPHRAQLAAGTYTFNVEAEDASGKRWDAHQELIVNPGDIPATPVPQGEWPMFMGNAAHTGYSAGPINNLPLRLAWSVDTGGDPDFSSPILGDGRLYLALKKRTKGRTNGVAAFDPATGKQLWLFPTPLAINHTPAFAKGVLCVAEMGGRIYGLDAGSGKERWHHDLIDNRGRYNYGAPVEHDGWFYAGVMRRMAKLRVEDGHPDWEKQIGRSDNDWISSYGSPAVSGDLLAMSGMFFGGEAFTIAKTQDGSRVWGHPADNGLLASATLAGEYVIYASMKSVLYVKRLNDGTDLWAMELGIKGGDANWSATTPAVKLRDKKSGIVVAGSGDGYMNAIDLATGRLLWTHVSDTAVFKLSPYRRDERPLLSSPTIAGDKVFFGSADGYLYCLDLETGKKLWSFHIGVPVLSTPLVTGNAVYVAAYDGRLYAFTSKTPE